MTPLHDQLTEHNVDAVLLTFLPDIRWACGFSGSSGMLLVARHETYFFSDGRYTVQAKREVQHASIHTPGYDLLGYMEKEGFLRDMNSILFQADHVTVDELNSWKDKFPHINWKSQSGLLNEAVASKRPDEVQSIQEAQRITDAVFDELLSIIKPGMTEKEVSARLIFEHLNRGADKMSFDPIVASGANGSLPHARPSSKRIEEGELVVIDMGCFKDGYASDMTRTIAVGEPGEKARNAYEAVLDAQAQAIQAAHAGMSGKELDSVARDVLLEAGYGEYFSHGLGHGLGLQIHEWPKLSYHVEHTLPEQSTVTIEPGVYIPDEFGIRIEDIIVLSSDGCRNLTSSPKQLIVL